MKKLLLFLFALLTGVGGAWADGTWNITSADLTTDGWTAMGESTPAGVTALGTYTAYYKTENVTLTAMASLEVRFKYTSGQHRLEVLGVDLLDGSGNIVASDYHFGYTGTAMSKNTYLLNAVAAGSYTVRYIINGNLSSSAGNITINTIKYADSFDNISQWYVVRIHGNQAHYMYYDTSNESTSISFTGSTSDINNDNYLWGFVKNGSGVSIYNRAAGSTLAVDNANPSKMSADGTHVSFQLGTVDAGTNGWDADAFFSVYADAGSYLNYQSDNLARWEDSDAGSTFMIYEVEVPTTLTATLTDVNGATYSFSYTGMAGMTEPSLTGCDGYTLTNGSWNGRTYTATINFPFPISSNGVANYTYIGSFNNKNGYSAADFLWHASGTSVIVHSGDVPDNTKSAGVYTENEKYEWAIEPTIANCAVTFTIKNVSTGKYIYSATNNNSHSGAVTLSETATPVTYQRTTATTTCSPINAFHMATITRYLSVNSVGNGTDGQLGVWAAVHDGISVGFYTPADFATLESNLIAACREYNEFITQHTIGTGLGEYYGDTKDAMATAYEKAIASSSVYTAAQLNADISTLENPGTKLTLNLPAMGGFYKIMGYATNKYAKAGTSGNNIPNSTGEATDGTDIWYYNADRTLLNFSSGLGTINTSGVASETETREETTFAESTCSQTGAKKIGVYELKSNYSGSQYWYSNTDKVDRNSSNNHVNCEWVVTKVTSLPVTITAAHWASLYAPVALTVPDGVTAYWGEENGDRITLHAIEAGEVIPAEEGVVLYAETAGTYNFAITTGGSIDGENALAGTVATITRTQTEGKYDSYILSGGSNGVGFYRDGASTLKGFKSYLPAGESGGSVKTFSFDTETAIAAIEAMQNRGQAYYDLSGRRVEKPVRGLYIVGGRKIFVK